MSIPIQNRQLALLIIDMQIGVIANAYKKEQVITNIKNLVNQARTNNISIIWVQHSDEELKENSKLWQIVPELKREENELLISKKFGDSFEDTHLESELKRLGIKKVFIAGAQTDACIRATIHGAFVRGYNTVLVADAHTTEDLTSYGLPSPELIIHFTNTYWTWQSAPGRRGSVMKTDEIKFKDVKNE